MSTLQLRNFLCGIAVLALTACGGGGGGGGEASESASYDLSFFKPSTRPALFSGSLGQSTCVLASNGVQTKMACWGRNGSGQLGVGSTDAKGDAANEMGPNLATLSLGMDTITQMATGSQNTCALDKQGRVKCWGLEAGSGVNAQVGLKNDDIGDQAGEMGDAIAYVPFGAGRTAKMVSVGLDHACAVLDNNSVKCWGQNSAGQLGQGNTTARGSLANDLGDNLPAVNLGTGRTARYVLAGSSFSCAHLDNNTVKCWGAGNLGKLGQGNVNHRGDDAGEMGDNLPAISLGAGRSVKQISVGGNYACALLDNNTIKCWGENTNGQLGLGDTDARGDSPGEMGDALPAIDLGTGRTAQWVVAGESAVCAKLDNNAIKCWGRNSSGELGLGDTQDRGIVAAHMGDNLPALDFGGLTVTQMAAGNGFFCASLSNATVKCWGNGANGKLGLGNTNDIGATSALDIVGATAVPLF